MSGPDAPFFGWPGWRHLRFAALISVAGIVWFLLVYGGCDAFTAQRTLRVRIHLDRELQFPFIPETVLVYMTIYLLFAGAPFILRQRREFLALALTLDAIILVAGIAFLLVPARLAFPPPENLGALPNLFRFADRLNLTYNLLPSLHVALSVACIAAYAPRTGPVGRVLLWLWGSAIAVSTLLTHQHHILDVVAGWALAVGASRWVYRRWLLARG
jgi:membrane-associated phospholipid phosphatase